MSYRRLRAIARKEFLHVLRDIRSLALALALPLVMLLLFGYALTLDVDRIPLAVYDQDATPQSRELIDQFRGSRYFQVVDRAGNYKSIERGIDRGKILMALIVPWDYSRNLVSGREASVQLLLDGSDSNTASIALGYAQTVTAAYGAQLRADAQRRLSGMKMQTPVDARIRVEYNEDLKSRNYIVPGLIAVSMMIISSLLTSLTISREWENGTMEQLLSTPVRPIELVLGKLSAYFVIGLIDMAICILVGVFVFHVPLRGNVLFLGFTSWIFLFGALSTGIFISASNRSQLVAYQLSLLVSFLPAFLLSGFIYSVTNMPKVIQLISYLVPARYYVRIVIAVFLKGVGAQALIGEVLLLIAYAALVFFGASRKMRQKVA
jgi:ABC-2 type transport system permease protein